MGRPGRGHARRCGLSAQRGTYRFEGRTALVTGAGSGMGRALSEGLAARGANLVLADVNEAALADVAVDAPARVTRHRLDVSDAEAVRALPAEVAAAHGGLDLLFNNAGVAVEGTFEQVAEADFDWLISVNFQGVVRMTRAFLPVLRGSDDARIVNTSSIWGILAPPGVAAYAASKFAVRGFSASLAHELHGSTVAVSVVHPGGVATRIAEDARIAASLTEAERAARIAAARKALTMPPERAAEAILRGVERRRTRIVVGRDAAMGVVLERVMPVTYWGLMRRLGYG